MDLACSNYYRGSLMGYFTSFIPSTVIIWNPSVRTVCLFCLFIYLYGMNPRIYIFSLNYNLITIVINFMFKLFWFWTLGTSSGLLLFEGSGWESGLRVLLTRPHPFCVLLCFDHYFPLCQCKMPKLTLQFQPQLPPALASAISPKDLPGHF